MVKKRKIEDAELEIVENVLGAQQVYADGVQGMIGVEGVTKINLFQYIQEVGGQNQVVMKKVIVARLAMPTGAMLSLGKWIQENIQEANQDG